MKPITEMTVAEIDAEIIDRAWNGAASAGLGCFMQPPSLSLDTCIAAMEAGGVSNRDVAVLLMSIPVCSPNIAETKKAFAANTLQALIAVQGENPPSPKRAIWVVWWRRGDDNYWLSRVFEGPGIAWDHWQAKQKQGYQVRWGEVVSYLPPETVGGPQ